MDVSAGSALGKTLERKAWGRFFNDGIFDIYLGVLFANVALWMVAAELDLNYGSTAVPAVIVLLLAGVFYRLAKKRITVPRMGHFVIESRRTRKIHVARAIGVGVTAILVAATVLWGVGAYPTGPSTAVILFGVVALEAVTLFSLGAYFLGVERFYVYGLLCVAGFLGAEIVVARSSLGHGWALVGLFGMPALVLTPTGIVLLVRFVRTYAAREGD
jgi:hypothetical protein